MKRNDPLRRPVQNPKSENRQLLPLSHLQHILRTSNTRIFV
jgi:hypothetical protein